MGMYFLDTKLQELAQIAAEYHKVAAENRELYNQVQDLKGKSFSFVHKIHSMFHIFY